MLHRTLVGVALAIAFSSVSALAQMETGPSAPADLSWIRAFAVPATPDTWAAHTAGGENRLNWDPRFESLLKRSLRQRQNFWFDHGRFTPVADLAREFIGVPGSVLLDANRYITVNGCVPHDCGDRGMVWIDLDAVTKPTLIFTATGMINDAPARESKIHLWLFASTKLNWQKLPPQFRSSLAQWWHKTTQVWKHSAPERIVLVTLVQPSGQMADLSPSLLELTEPAAAANNQLTPVQ